MTEYTKVCEHHFRPEEIRKQSCVRKDLKEVARCGILHPGLWEKGDSITADRGFTIQELLDPLGVKVNIPAFLMARSSLTRKML